MARAPGGKPRPPAGARPRRAGGSRPSPAASDWREGILAELRDMIRRADPSVVEEVKWRKPSNPDGVPVWSHDGILCIGNVLKNAVRLTFPKGALIRDPTKLFNTRLDSRSVRAVDVFEGETVNAVALTAIVREAVRLNALRTKNR